ncbi:hypothetical protein DM02DRAFT_349108 [Periconia macrospinosa]|uniref:Rhodopsin domain-containing protein n=1 Tax=Periconia macrospinosa TaxID=97972 RepID=A0A2V1DTG4_9PLEO|nr:hypothetical protein DM02DRAFT_349108 [Periconia macrospinosa]
MSSLEPESGIWYAVCWVVLFVRLLSRRIHNGSWTLLKMDDYLICVAMITLTILMAVMHIVVHTDSNLIAPGEDISHFTQKEIDNRIYGSKLVLVVEQMQIITIWLVKSCLLLMYWRMTALLPQRKVVIAVSTYVAVGFVVMEILYLGVWCRPFNQYWAVPPASKQCSAATNHLITNAVLNISSDLMIIAIPMPLLFKVRLPLKNKLILCGIFMIGTFTIVAAVLNKYYSFNHPFGTEWTEWYLRESYTAILCANLPLTYPFIQRVFRLRSWSQNSHHGGYLSGSYPRLTTRSGLRSQRKSHIPLKSGILQHGGISKTVSVNINNSYAGDPQRRESQEGINIPELPRTYDGTAGGQHSWISADSTSPTSPVSPSHKTAHSVTTASLKSEEDRT